MRKAKTAAADELRPEYKRSDFGTLVRGKYIDRLRTSSNVVVIAPEVTDLFPNAAAVNAALLSLAEIANAPVPDGADRAEISGNHLLE